MRNNVNLWNYAIKIQILKVKTYRRKMNMKAILFQRAKGLMK